MSYAFRLRRNNCGRKTGLGEINRHPGIEDVKRKVVKL